MSTTSDAATLTETALPLDLSEIESRVKACPRLPSLRTIDSALRELLNADQRYTSQISEVIRRDPSLTARLLRLVNSVYYGLTTPISSIEEAVFYLGVRQIRQLATVTPVIEDFQRMVGKSLFAWREFWRHCIGVAIMTREVISCVQVPTDESDYVAGLVHDVGKIVMASSFPAHFYAVQNRAAEEGASLMQIEREVFGMTHAELGALYLRNHHLPKAIVDTAEFHHRPELAAGNPIVAAVQVADLLVRHAKLGNSGNLEEVPSESWLESTGWGLLFPATHESERAIAHAALKRSLERLPTILEGLV
ncbi:MAG: HDOD domain-containing protein [Verrucomicrobiota bacterium]